MAGRKTVKRKWQNTLWYTMQKMDISALEIQHRCNETISHSTVTRIRHMQYVPSIEIAVQIARAMGRPVEWVFYNQDAPEEEPDE